MNAMFAERVEWELTRACDLKCRHCFNRPGRARTHELDTREALDVAEELGKLGCRAVTLSGGEPTLRSDWPRIAEVLSRAGVVVQLISNGQQFGREAARLAREAGVGAVQLSADGRASVHDDIRRRAGAFARVERAARCLREADIPVGFITTLLPSNVAELETLAGWVSQWDPVVWQVGLAVPVPGRAESLPPSALGDLVRRLEALQRSHAYLTVGDNVGLGGGHRELRRLDNLSGVALSMDDLEAATHHCEAGRSVLGLRSDGTVTGCLALPGEHGVGSVRQFHLHELWMAARRARRQRLELISGACGSCAQKGHCQSGCHAMALASTGRLDNPYCLAHAAAPVGSSRPAKRLAGMAASLAVASLLGAGCGPRESPQRPAAPPPSAPPEAKKPDAGVAAPAPRADATVATPPPAVDAAAARPRATSKPRPAATVRFRPHPCMYSHIGCFHLRRKLPRATPPRPARPKKP